MINGIINNLIGGSSVGKALAGTLGNNSTQKDNVEQIGDNIFKFNLFLDNGSSRVGLKFSAVEELNIIDDLRYFFVYGTLTINYNEDALESFENVGGGVAGGIGISEPYQFRGDGRDILEIDIMPQIKEQKCLEVYCTENEKKKFNIKHTCSIYKYEDISKGKGQKSRKFYFWDRDFQLLNEINIDFSTGDIVKSKKAFLQSGNEKIPVSNSNTDTSMYTGDIIDAVLKKTLIETCGLQYTKGKWDKGGSRLNYSNTNSASPIDIINYALKMHVSDQSNNYLPCILKKERYTEKYDLIPINKFYKGSSLFSSIPGIGTTLSQGPEVIEDFYIGKVESNSTDITAPILRAAGGKKTNLSDYNLIDDYSFTRVSGEDLQKTMNTKVVVGLDPRGSFNSSLKANDYKNVTKLYDEVFVKPNTSGVGKPPASNLSTNKLRETNKNIDYTFVPYAIDENQTRSMGVNDSLRNIFFKNTSISFKSRGNTMRQSGKFFTINRADSNISNSHDNTVLGKYMITYIRHEFKDGTYGNTILGIKPYSQDAPNFANSI